jgi:hypothetical protein
MPTDATPPAVPDEGYLRYRARRRAESGALCGLVTPRAGDGPMAVLDRRAPASPEESPAARSLGLTAGEARLLREGFADPSSFERLRAGAWLALP